MTLCLSLCLYLCLSLSLTHSLTHSLSHSLSPPPQEFSSVDYRSNSVSSRTPTPPGRYSPHSPMDQDLPMSPRRRSDLRWVIHIHILHPSLLFCIGFQCFSVEHSMLPQTSSPLAIMDGICIKNFLSMIPALPQSCVCVCVCHLTQNPSPSTIQMFL